MINIEKLFLTIEDNIRSAMNKLSETSAKTLMIIDGKKKLLGTVTDGDIRRWILNEGNLDESIGSIMNRKPVIAYKPDGLDKIKELMLLHRIECVPMLNETSQVIKFYTFEDVLNESDIHLVRKKIEIPVVVMAGGKGLRLKPFTNILPKPLMPAGDKPIIEKIMNLFHEVGVESFFVTLNHKADMIKAYFSGKSLPYVLEMVEEDKDLGTIGGISLLKDCIKGAFFVTNCDIIVKADYADILDFHKKEKNSLTMVCSMKNFKIPYGVVHHEGNGKFKYMQEKPEMDFLVNTGVYIFEEELMNIIPPGEHFDINNLIEKIKKENMRIGVYPVPEKSWFDMGQWEKYHESIKEVERM